MSSRHNARRAAVQALYQWDITGQAADEIEPQFKQIHDLQNVDRKYFKQAVDDIPAMDAQLVEIIKPHISSEFSQLDRVEKAILRLGTYELLCKKDVPTKVVLNEMVELAKVFGSDKSYKFINGAMDKIATAINT